MVSTIDHLATASRAGRAARRRQRGRRRDRRQRGARGHACRTCAGWAATCSPSCRATTRHQRRSTPRGAPVPGADAARLRAEGRDEMPFKLDIRSVTVPGCVDGWMALHERFGRRRPRSGARCPRSATPGDGFPASTMLAASVAGACPTVRAPATCAGRPGRAKTGEMIRRPGVARALEAIVSDGRAGFYEGEFGEGLLTLGNGEYAAADFESAGRSDGSTRSASRRSATSCGASRRARRATSSCRARGSPTGSPLPDDPDDPLWAAPPRRGVEAGWP